MPEIRLKLRPGRAARSYPAWLEWPRWLVPYRFRAVHRWWAHRVPFFWLPLPDVRARVRRARMAGHPRPAIVGARPDQSTEARARAVHVGGDLPAVHP